MNTLKKALIIGINNYGNPALNLKSSVNDAEAIHKLISHNENGDTNFDDVTLGIDVSTKADLNGMIIELFRHESNMSLFYFSGHGYNDSLGYHLATPDGRVNDRGVSMRQVMNLVSKSPAKNKVVILDCCFAGGITKADLADTGGIYLDEGVTILASTQCAETAHQGNNHSIFTNLLIQAFEGGAADLNGHVTAAGIYAYIDKAMGAGNQRPVFKTNISEFVSLRKVLPSVSEEILNNLTVLFPDDPNKPLPLDSSFEYTNKKGKKHKLKIPYADDENVAKFKQLQKLEGVGLVVPIDEEHMYWAAMNKKACKLTPLGQHYWRVIEKMKAKA